MSEEKQYPRRYIIVSGVDANALERRVNNSLGANCDLLGAPFVCVDGMWYQAMIYWEAR